MAANLLKRYWKAILVLLVRRAWKSWETYVFAYLWGYFPFSLVLGGCSKLRDIINFARLYPETDCLSIGTWNLGGWRLRHRAARVAFPSNALKDNLLLDVRMHVRLIS